jgi:4-azaleucine resistance transporter AzlC
MTASTAVAEFRAGALAIAPAAVAVVPFGLLLGALAAQKGLSPLEVGLMSSLVFAGSSQFVAIELWAEPAPWAVLGLTTFTINLRHVMMGASLGRRLEAFTPGQRLLAVFALADEIWAMAERRAAEGRLAPAFYAGLAMTLYLNWIGWTAAGTVLGALLADPARWGFDFAFTAIFIGLIIGFWRGYGTGLVIAASALVAVLVERSFGGVWHIIAGGMAGMAAGAALAWASRDPPG